MHHHALSERRVARVLCVPRGAVEVFVAVLLVRARACLCACGIERERATPSMKETAAAGIAAGSSLCPSTPALCSVGYQRGAHKRRRQNLRVHVRVHVRSLSAARAHYPALEPAPAMPAGRVQRRSLTLSRTHACLIYRAQTPRANERTAHVPYALMAPREKPRLVPCRNGTDPLWNLVRCPGPRYHWSSGRTHAVLRNRFSHCGILTYLRDE